MYWINERTKITCILLGYAVHTEQQISYRSLFFLAIFDLNVSGLDTDILDALPI